MKFSSSDTNRLAETAMQVAGDHGYVVMVFCDSKYKRLLENWLLFAESHEEKFPILICALDDSLANEMTGRDILLAMFRGLVHFQIYGAFAFA